MPRPRLLYVTDLQYRAQGREYRNEDIDLTARLASDFDIAMCSPHAAEALMGSFDAVVVRNSGPVSGYRAAYHSFRSAALATGQKVFNELTGRGDMAGKQYLIDLTAIGAPVVPTISAAGDVAQLPSASRYIVKPKDGADSIGVAVIPAAALATIDRDDEMLVQPLIEFDHEVSFVVVGQELVYALVAPDPAARWRLEPYEPTAADRAFVDTFIAWNGMRHGIQRVDACRTTDGDLLLMELEDLNPFLSLDLLDDDVRDRFVAAMVSALGALLR